MAWEKVASVADVKPGMGAAATVRGRALALFVVDGRYYCIDDICPHMGGPLADGDVEGDVVYCPWHYWPINIRTGQLTFDESVCTETFPCKVEGDDILADLG